MRSHIHIHIREGAICCITLAGHVEHETIRKYCRPVPESSFERTLKEKKVPLRA
jgi:hypothetical protein